MYLMITIVFFILNQKCAYHLRLYCVGLVKPNILIIAPLSCAQTSKLKCTKLGKFIFWYLLGRIDKDMFKTNYRSAAIRAGAIAVFT